jgi:hypothetical protein
MQSLPAPAWGLRRRARAARGRLRARVALAFALLALVAAGVLALTRDDGSRPAEVHAPAVALIGGHPLQQADCSDWSSGSDAQREAIVGALARDVGGPTGFGPAATLPREDARAMLTRACSGTIARHWLLYELYIRAAGFQSYRP